MSDDLRPRTDYDAIPRPNKNFIVRPNEVKGFLPTASAKPDRFFYVLYGDTVLEWDGYRIGPVGAPDDSREVNWTLLVMCPKCHNNLKLDSLQKHLEVEARQAGIQSEPIQCSYKIEFGTLCTWRVVLERPTKRHDRIVTVDGGRQIVIDAVAKDAR
jgi:hypothetical protein